jgi:hypothetical protein
VRAALDDWPITNDSAVRGVIDNLAVQHAAVLEREMDQLAIFRRWLRLELNDRGLSVRRIQVNSVRHGADSPLASSYLAYTRELAFSFHT